jgi:hypothetical protein
VDACRREDLLHELAIEHERRFYLDDGGASRREAWDTVGRIDTRDQTPRTDAPKGGPARPPSDLAWLAGLGALLLSFFLGLFIVRGFRFPVGPDGPVYLWWTRLAGAEGLSTLERPGVPAVTLALAGTLHLPIVAVAAGLQCALGLAVGLAGAALLRAWRSEDRTVWILGGALTGLFAVHLVSGYLANLALAATFLAAASALASAAGHRGVIAAAALLGAGGFAHPQFFLVAIVILGLTAGFSWRDHEGGWRSEPGRAAAAILGAGAVVGAGFLALLAGPAVLRVDTSRDAFLRRAGMLETLRSLYRDRFVHRAARYVQWVSVPLAVLGLRRVAGFVGRFLSAWGVVTIAGVAFGLATGLLPPDRFVTFGYVVPLLAAVGAMRLWRRWHPKRALATALIATFVVLMTLGTFFAWRRQEPFLTPVGVEAVTTASPYVDATAPGTPVFFVVETGGSSITFFATQAANVIRASVPPDRIADVHVLVFSSDGASPERVAMARDSFRAYAAASTPLVIDPRPFDGPIFGRAVTLLAGRVSCALPTRIARVSMDVQVGFACGTAPPRAGPVPTDPLEPSSPGQIALATIAVLALLGVGGYGWARASRLDTAAAAALSPAFGLGALTLVAIALERVGLPLSGSAGPTIAAVVSVAGGYLVQLVGERRALGQPPPQVP